MNKMLMTGLAIAGALGSVLIWVGGISADAADTKSRVNQIEKRAEEDRKNAREAQAESHAYLKQLDQATQIILQKISAMEATQRAERRAERRDGR